MRTIRGMREHCRAPRTRRVVPALLVGGCLALTGACDASATSSVDRADLVVAEGGDRRRPVDLSAPTPPSSSQPATEMTDQGTDASQVLVAADGSTADPSLPALSEDGPGLPVATSDQPTTTVERRRGRWSRSRRHWRRTTTTTTDDSSSTTSATGSSTTAGGTPPPPPPTPPPTTTATVPVGGNATRVITNADAPALANGFTVPAGEVWEFDTASNVAIQVRRNVRVEGVLRMRPSTASVEHVLEFVGVNESDFVGGGMRVLESDVGLWVTGAGQLDLRGARRTGWTRLSGSAVAGASELTLIEAPTGWRVGDEISVAPTAPTSVRDFSTQFEERRIAAIEGSTLRLDAPLSHDHPMVNGRWTAEVMNLTRNVRIEGEGNNSPRPSGRSHILIMSSKPQTIQFAQIRHMGARTVDAERDPTDGLLGRYSLHFHHNGDGSRGSLVEGVVVRNSGNSAYVPHASHGITMRDNIAYDGWEGGFWWDPPGPRFDRTNDSNDITLDHNIVALLKDDPHFRGYNLTGFALMTGTNLTITNSVAVGVQGNANSNGFHWPGLANQHPANVWSFSNNLSHNNRADGLFVWQNDRNDHHLQNFVAYNNGGFGVEHGAYRNSYRYSNLDLFGNAEGALRQQASSSVSEAGQTMSFERIRSDGDLVLRQQRLPSSVPATYRDCSFTGVIVDNGRGEPGYYDFVECGLEPSDFVLADVRSGTTIRVQDGSAAFRINSDGDVTSIDPFD